MDILRLTYRLTALDHMSSQNLIQFIPLATGFCIYQRFLVFSIIFIENHTRCLGVFPAGLG